MKASRWEILGAWLRIWTPPRDVDIPPVPRRAAAIVALIVLAAITLVIVVVAPAIDRSKKREAAREARREALAVRRERARLTLDQRAQRGRAERAARLYAAGRPAAARAALLGDVRASVARDARARVSAGTLPGPVRRVRCSYLAGGGRGGRVRLECLAISTQTSELAVGQPFAVAGSLRDGRYAWCHENPRPGEGLAGRGVAVPLPAACIS